MDGQAVNKCTAGTHEPNEMHRVRGRHFTTRASIVTDSAREHDALELGVGQQPVRYHEHRRELAPGQRVVRGNGGGWIIGILQKGAKGARAPSRARPSLRRALELELYFSCRLALDEKNCPL